MIQLDDQVVVIGEVAERLPESSGRVAVIKEEPARGCGTTITKFLRAVADWMWLPVGSPSQGLRSRLARGGIRRLELRALTIGVLDESRGEPDARRTSLRASGRPPRRGRRHQSLRSRHVEHPPTGPRRPGPWVSIIPGVLTLLGVWFVGDRRAAQGRPATQPHPSCRAALPTYTIAVVALLVLALVAPTVVTSWVMALILVALIVVGIEVVRAIVRREVAQST